MPDTLQSFTECPECGSESLSAPLKSGRQACRECGWVGKPKIEMAGIDRHDQMPVEEDFAFEIPAKLGECLNEASIIPVSISESASQPIVFFSDGSQKVLLEKGDKLKLQVFIWNWRINNRKSEEDYATLGLNFSKIRRGIVTYITEKDSLHLLGIDPDKPGNKFTHHGLRYELEAFLEVEIKRYFKDIGENSRILTRPLTGGLKVFTEKDYKAKQQITWGISAAVVGLLCVMGMTSGGGSLDPTSIEYAEETGDYRYQLKKAAICSMFENAAEIDERCRF